MNGKTSHTFIHLSRLASESYTVGPHHVLLQGEVIKVLKVNRVFCHKTILLNMIYLESNPVKIKPRKEPTESEGNPFQRKDNIQNMRK